MIYISCNWELLNRINYNNPKVIKNILYHYDDLMVIARKGDSVAGAICFDMRKAMRVRGVLTFKQRRYLSLWWKGYSYTDIATMYRRSPWSVNATVMKAFGNISKYLCKK